MFSQQWSILKCVYYTHFDVCLIKCQSKDMLNTVTGVPEWGLSWRSLMEWCLENLEPSGIWRWRDERQDLGENYKPWAGHGRKKHGFCQSSASDTQTIGPWNFRFGCQPMEIDLCKTNQRPHALPALCETVSVFSPSFMWVKGQSVKGSGSDWADRKSVV